MPMSLEFNFSLLKFSWDILENEIFNWELNTQTILIAEKGQHSKSICTRRKGREGTSIYTHKNFILVSSGQPFWSLCLVQFPKGKSLPPQYFQLNTQFFESDLNWN